MGTTIHIDTLRDIAVGATVLGTGGGGDPHIGRLMAERAIERHGPVELIDPAAVADDALVVPSAMIGAPTVIVEKPPNGGEAAAGFAAVERHLGAPPDATMSIEVGGLNSTVPIGVAASLDLPLVDADGMGRAFPEVQMVTLTLGGIDATPMSLTDEHGDTAVLSTEDNAAAERLARAVTVEMGGSATATQYPLTGVELREHAIPGSMTRARDIGATVRSARADGEDPVAALLEETGGYELIHGKVTDVDRRTEGGFAVGSATIEGLEADAGRGATVEFQNENLIARGDNGVLATVPDLLTVLDAETAEAVTTEGLRYGQRVRLLGIPAPEQWRTEAGLDLVGPGYFGYEVEYTPLERRWGGR